MGHGGSRATRKPNPNRKINMKWLILIILFSCGKNKSLTQSKISDIDGDQILDFQEASGLDKFIAQVDSVPEIKGSLYKSNQQMNGSDFGIRLTSEAKLKEQSLFLLLGTQKENAAQFFSEQKTLNIDLGNGIPLEESAYIDIDLVFDQSSYHPVELLYTNAVTTKSLGEWHQHMQISLSKEEYNKILLRKSYLSLKLNEQDAYYNNNRKKNEEIESKTYRIFYFDDNISKTIYVSKQMPFLDFIERYGITKARDITLSRPVHLMEKNIIKSWWYKKVDEKNFVIGNISPTEMINFQEANLKTVTGAVSRSFGEPKEKIIINFQKQNTIRLKLRGEIATRNFTLTTKDALQHLSNNPCKHYLRNIIEDQPRSIRKDELSAVSIYQDGNKIKLNELTNFSIKEKNDQLGNFFEVEFISNAKEMIFILDPLRMTTHLISGTYQNTCDPQDISNEVFFSEKSYKLNIELNAESF